MGEAGAGAGELERGFGLGLDEAFDCDEVSSPSCQAPDGKGVLTLERERKQGHAGRVSCAGLARKRRRR